MPVDSAIAAVMPTMSGRSSAIATSSSAKTLVHFTLGAASSLPVSGRTRRRAVQAVGLVVLGRAVAVALAGHRVHDDRAAEALGPAQRRLHRAQVVAVDRADVLDAEVLEHRLRADRVLDALLDRVQHLEERLADQRRLAQRVLDQVEHLLVARVEPQRGEVVGEPADGRRVRAAVVVDDDDQRGCWRPRCCSAPPSTCRRSARRRRRPRPRAAPRRAARRPWPCRRRRTARSRRGSSR